MRRDVQGAVLLLLGILLVRLTLGGSYVYYVKVSMKPFLLLTAAVLLGLAAWSLWQAWRRTEEHDDGHGHDGVPRVAWLMVLPVLVVFLVSPRPLGAYTAARQLATAPVVAEPAELLPLPAGDPVDLPIADYITRAVWGQGQTLEGRDVRLTGFRHPGSGRRLVGDPARPGVLRGGCLVVPREGARRRRLCRRTPGSRSPGAGCPATAVTRPSR